MPEIPEEIKDRLARTTAEFAVKYSVDLDDVTEFILDIIQIYEDFMQDGLTDGRWKD